MRKGKKAWLIWQVLKHTKEDEAERSKRMSDTPYGSERCFVCDGLVSASALTPRVTFAGRQHPYHDECGVKFLINFLLTRKKNQIGRARGSTITLDEMNLDARLEKEYEESLPKRLELVL